jgi:hypothetical protein
MKIFQAALVLLPLLSSSIENALVAASTQSTKGFKGSKVSGGLRDLGYGKSGK